MFVYLSTIKEWKITKNEYKITFLEQNKVSVIVNFHDNFSS